MGANFQFGGGAEASSMTAIVMAATLIASVLLVILPRKYAPIPILLVTFLTPFGQQIFFGGFHFYAMRIFVLVGAARMLLVKLTKGEPLFSGGLNGLDRVFYCWAIVRGVAYLLDVRQGGAVANQVGAWMDVLGVYFLFRYLLQDQNDIFRVIKVFSLIMGFTACCMFYEHQTRINVFSYISGHAIVPWIRSGSVRAQGVFGNSITAGSFGAVLLPLFYWLWKSGKARLLAVIGLVGAAVVSVTSMASTPFTGFLAAILALCLWPIRKYMRWVRWGIVFTVLGLALVMKAPVWYIITKVNFVGGDSWDRANLITQTVNHFSSWWLVGTTNNASWGDFTWDQCNQFAGEAIQGGLATLILFIFLLKRAFGRVGVCRKQSEGDRQEWYYWCLGSALFANIIVFLGIDYFDNMRALWMIFLVMISVATLSADTLLAKEPSLASPVPAIGMPAAGNVSIATRTARTEFPKNPAPVSYR